LIGPAGSSPLARGSPDGDGQGGEHPRIIPARAGFTTAWTPLVLTSRDHPRSRGVHASWSWGWSTVSGSSPLARGSRDARAGRLHAVRIIPARAGFTSWSTSSPAWPRDHPRSRGVYAGLGLPERRVRGSSPLARGSRRWVG